MPDPNEAPANPSPGNGDPPAAPPTATPPAENPPAGGPKEPAENMVPQSRLNEYAQKTRDAEERAAKAEADLAAFKEGAGNEPEKPTDPFANPDELETPVTHKEILEREQKAAEEAETKAMAERINADCKRYEKEIDGSDGRPKFVTEEVKKWAQEHPFDRHPDPRVVYERMHHDALLAWQVKQAVEKERGTHHEPSGSPAAPAAPDTSKMSEKEHDAHVKQKYGG